MARILGGAIGRVMDMAGRCTVAQYMAMHTVTFTVAASMAAGTLDSTAVDSMVGDTAKQI